MIMKKLQPQKLHVQRMEQTDAITPTTGRKYTLTHSDMTGNLYLHIGRTFFVQHIGPARDEVLAEWKQVKQTLILFVYVYIGNQSMGKVINQWRKSIFDKELPLALEAIRYGDHPLFQAYPSLDFSPILVHFTSEYPDLNTTEYYGSPYMYK